MSCMKQTILGFATIAMLCLTSTAWAENGKCYSDKDCGPGVSCISSKCATGPDGECYSDKDCGGRSCRSGHCS